MTAKIFREVRLYSRTSNKDVQMERERHTGKHMHITCCVAILPLGKFKSLVDSHNLGSNSQLLN